MLYLCGSSCANILVLRPAQTVAGSSNKYNHRMRVLHTAHDALIGAFVCVLSTISLRILEITRQSWHNWSARTRAAFAHMNCVSHFSLFVIGNSHPRTQDFVLRVVKAVAVVSSCVKAVLPVASLASYFSTLISYIKMKH